MAETWVLNKQLHLTGDASYIASFTCNGTVYAGIYTTSETVRYLFNTSQLGGQRAYTRYGWDNQVYRTIVFDESPSGNLLEWLQANGTKQSEPEPPEPTTPKNACLIDGTGYSIKSGKALINGTVYTIKKGRTLIGGTGYDITIAESTIPITVVGGVTSAPRDFATAYAMYNGQKYVDTTFEVQPGDTVQIYLKAQSRQFARRQSISLNGVIVSSGSVNTALPYDYAPTKPATITISMYPVTMPDKQYSTVAIVETG